ncbi:MAG: hypothetical protein IKM13_02015, partial [Clostridia bacterium]|nr:hypothetical protein [Clostridia bacterium]
GTFRHAHIRLVLQTATFLTANGRPYLIAPLCGSIAYDLFSGLTGPKISLTGNQVIMPYPVDFCTVGDGFPVPPPAPSVRRIWFCTNLFPRPVNGPGRADVGIGPYAQNQVMMPYTAETSK